VDSSSALFIDASNLSFNDVRLFADHSSKTKSFLQAELEKTNFGNVTVFSWILNVEMERIRPANPPFLKQFEGLCLP